MELELPALIFWGLVFGLIFYVISIYNTLVKLRNYYKNAFSQIEVQLKRRYDLIPNLVDTAKGYLTHERETLQSVIEARNSAASMLGKATSNLGDTASIANLANAEGLLSDAMGKLNIVMEDYPELKANENMQQLAEELSSTENRIAFARQAFNDAVTVYNNYRSSFPPVLFATTFGHAADAALLIFGDRSKIKVAPKVSF